MSDITHIVEQTQFASNEAMEFLAYRLGGEEYGIPIHQVQELRRYEKTTKIANMPEHIKGVINLRGTIVPIIDLRLIFKHATVTYDELTVVIILNLEG
ncbi:MAG: chemotaxis protein CheW, partial [Burkholderiales bacterium]|nr:chemotaxis protein CheW [Burkholderiales bacterium]